MIDPLVAALVEHVVTPQSLDTVDAERRVYLDPDRVPLDVRPQTAEVVPLTSSPVSATIGEGGAVWTYQHVLVVDVSVQHGDLVEAYRLRDLVVGDLFDRALALDWPNLDLGPGTDFTSCQLSAAYDAGPAGEQLAAFATLTFTILTERRP